MIDAQSLKDLDVPALIGRLDYCRTKGGKAQLAALAQLPDTTYSSVVERQAAVRYLAGKIETIRLQVDEQDVFYVLQYLGAVYEGDDVLEGGLAGSIASVKKFLFRKPAYYFVLSGVQSVARLSRFILQLVHTVGPADAPPLLQKVCTALGDTLALLGVDELGDDPAIPRVYMADKHLRIRHGHAVRQLLRDYYELEAWCSIAKAHTRLGVTFPKIGGPGTELVMRGLRHPLLEQAVANTVDTGVKHLVIITGPNMSGKSTMMKSLGLAFIMAYLGMGVAAEEAVMPVVTRIVTYIDIQDDLSLGYSYFLNEVKRVKTILQQVAEAARVLVICDELFKGTNVQDALECNQLVISTFLQHPRHYYFLATHYTTIAEKYMAEPACYTACFEGLVTPDGITFSYTWQPGISGQRIGLHILQRELAGRRI